MLRSFLGTARWRRWRQPTAWAARARGSSWPGPCSARTRRRPGPRPTASLPRGRPQPPRCSPCSRAPRTASVATPHSWWERRPRPRRRPSPHWVKLFSRTPPERPSANSWRHAAAQSLSQQSMGFTKQAIGLVGARARALGQDELCNSCMQQAGALEGRLLYGPWREKLRRTEVLPFLEQSGATWAKTQTGECVLELQERPLSRALYLESFFKPQCQTFLYIMPRPPLQLWVLSCPGV